MLKNVVKKTGLLLFLILLCIIFPIANGKAMSLNWASPTTRDLSSVFMVSGSDGWAVGSVGAILRWNGTDWNTFSGPTGTRLNSVYMTSSSSGWAMGNYGLIIRWNGTAWNTVTSPTA